MKKNKMDCIYLPVALSVFASCDKEDSQSGLGEAWLLLGRWEYPRYCVESISWKEDRLAWKLNAAIIPTERFTGSYTVDKDLSPMAQMLLQGCLSQKNQTIQQSPHNAYYRTKK